jgi:(1->4)-alpha-D-glucan 1-alpha-D-glucosylmutase
MQIPRSTYRLQINSSFTLAEAANTADYIREVGADYLPLTIARSRTRFEHGYDVIDHTRIDPSRAVQQADALVQKSRALMLGLLVDIVPNHMGVATPFSTVGGGFTTHGCESRYAPAFDVDWKFGGEKIRIPALEDDALDALLFADGELHYKENRYPVAPGTADDGADAQTVHSRQHYELINWRRADAELNYRRFFGINTLAGIRVEDEEVFRESHTEIARWFRDGLVDGLRLDHPDGLAQPGEYLRNLAAVTGDSYVCRRFGGWGAATRRMGDSRHDRL